MTIINAIELTNIITNIVMQDYSLSNLIITNKDLLLNSKFLLLLYFFFGIKKRLLTVFYL